MRKLTLAGLAAITHEEALKTIDPKTSEYYQLVQDIRENCDLDITFIDEIIQTPDDVSDAIPYLVDRMCSEKNAHVVGALVHALTRKYCFHLIDINKLIEKYKSFEDPWMKTSNSGAKGQLARLISLMIDKDDLDKIYDVFLNDENLGDTRLWFLYELNKYKANQKFYDYLVAHKDTYNHSDEIETYESGFTGMKNRELGLVINNILNSKKWKKFAEENKSA